MGARSFQRFMANSSLIPNGPTAQQLPQRTSVDINATDGDPQNGHGFSSGKVSMGNTSSFKFSFVEVYLPLDLLNRIATHTSFPCQRSTSFNSFYMTGRQFNRDLIPVK